MDIPSSRRIKEFRYLIVPSPGNPSFREDEIIFYLDKDNVPYLGAEDRLKAAVLKAKKAEKVVLIGGSQSGVMSMFIYFKKRMCEFSHNDKPELICLVSKPDSAGNLSAFKKYFEQQKNGKNKDNINIAIISNEYHLTRLGLIWTSL